MADEIEGQISKRGQFSRRRAFLDDKDVKIIGIEAGGHGLDGDEHCASMNAGRPGVLHGNRTYLLQNDDGQILDGHSISAGLDYPGVGPEHSWLRDSGRVDYVPIMDDEAMEAFQLTTRTEGIIPALESSHAIAHAMKIAPKMGKDEMWNLVVFIFLGAGGHLKQFWKMLRSLPCVSCY